MQHAQPHSLPSRWMCRANSEFSLLKFVFSWISSERSRVLPSSTDIQQWGFLFWQIKHRWCQGWESIVTWGCELELELDFFLSFLEEFDCFTQHFTVGFLLARLRNFVQSIFKFPAGQSELKLTSFPAKSKMSSEYIANQSWNVTFRIYRNPWFGGWVEAYRRRLGTTPKIGIGILSRPETPHFHGEFASQATRLPT